MNSQVAQRIERLALLSAVAVALGGAGGCGSTPLQGDGGPGAGGSSAGARGGIDGGADGEAGAGGACTASSETLFCLTGSGATVDTCGDFLVEATCLGGQWFCPGGTGVPTRCRCPGLGSPICVCTSDGWQCGTGGAGGQGGGGGQGGAGGRGGAGGQSGGAGGAGRGGAGGSGVPCADATTLETCDARSDCHSVFVDPRNCACAALGCCARFARCADGDRARCTGGAIACDALTPYCESPYVVSYTQSCYEGCVRVTACAP